MTDDIPFFRHPVEDIEPEPEINEAYREAALRMVAVFSLVYEFVCQSQRPRMAMQQVGVALGLPAALRASETELALLNQVTRQDFSKGVTRFLRISQLPPAFSLKSDDAKRTSRHSHNGNGACEN